MTPAPLPPGPSRLRVAVAGLTLVAGVLALAMIFTGATSTPSPGAPPVAAPHAATRGGQTPPPAPSHGVEPHDAATPPFVDAATPPSVDAATQALVDAHEAAVSSRRGHRRRHAQEGEPPAPQAPGAPQIYY